MNMDAALTLISLLSFAVLLATWLVAPMRAALPHRAPVTSPTTSAVPAA